MGNGRADTDDISGSLSAASPLDGDNPVELLEFTQDEALFDGPIENAAGPDPEPEHPEPEGEDPPSGELEEHPFGRAAVDEPAQAGVSRSAVAAGRDSTTAPLALYRRYRPDNFADVIGQEHVTEPLQRALTNNRVNHAYLFSGPRGCGKTTSARILARCLNCERGPRAEPCGECRSCRDLARGGPGSIDVIEIDAASHGGVDDARDLRERAFFAPVSSRYKIYVVDEAHMVTTAGFNALLKLVEEPPPHVKFIFATTEPEKVIGTIRSRTHHYPFRLVPPKVLGAYLARLCTAEGIEVEPAVLPLVVRAGAGSVRDSLSVLDQLLGGAGDDGVTYAHAAALLGYTPDSLLDEFVDALAAGDAAGVFACVDKVIEVGQDPRRFAEDLLRRLRDLLVVSAVPNALSSGLVEVSGDQAERLSSQAAALGPGELTRGAEVIASGLTEMRGTTAPRLHLELMCARILLPGADVDDRGIHARLDRLERRVGMSGHAGDVAPASPVAGAGGAHPASDLTVTGTATPELDDWPEPVRPGAAPPPAGQGARGSGPARDESEASWGDRVAAAADAPRDQGRGPIDESGRAGPGSHPSAEDRPPDAWSQGRAAPSRGRSSAGSPPSDRTPGARPQIEEPSGPQPRGSSGSSGPAVTSPDPVPIQPTLSVTDVRRLWPEVLEEVKGRRRFTWILLSQNAHVAEVSDGTLLLAMLNAGARDSFSKGGSEDILREALVTVLGVDLRISTMVDPSAAGSANRSAGSPQRQSSPSRPKPPVVRAAPSERPPARPDQVEPPDEDDPPPPDQETEGPRLRVVDDAALDRARQAIKPTRTGRRDADPVDDPDTDADVDDANLDEGTESHTELLARQLGAQIIAEEEDRT
ncbi:MAG TPA: DNA polymerase III subunit gamma and tau [Microlunatus sp.]|nr:DNA polymerase III subunit gamma and tau [Microlunatus sp.]